MKVFLSTTRSPYDASIEIVLPGIQERLNGITVHIDSKLSGIEASIRGIETSIPDKKAKKLDNVVNTIKEIPRRHGPIFTGTGFHKENKTSGETCVTGSK